MSIFTNVYGRTVQALSMKHLFSDLNMPGIWVAFGRWTPWTDEKNPDPESWNVPWLDEILGYVRMTEVTLTKEDATGEVLFAKTRYKLINDADAFKETATGVLVAEEVQYNDTLPLSDFRQISLWYGVTPKPWLSSRYWLLPYALGRGTVQGPFVIESSVNDVVRIRIDDTTLFTTVIPAGTHTAAAIASYINASVEDSLPSVVFTEFGTAYASDGFLFIRSNNSTYSSRLEIMDVLHKAYATLGLSEGVFTSEIELQDSTELLVNPYFDDGTIPPFEWYTSNCSAEVVSIAPYEGTKCARVTALADNGYMYQTVTVIPKHAYEFSIWTKSDTSAMYSSIECYDVTNGVTLWSSTNRNYTNWLPFFKSFVIPDGCTQIQLRCKAINTGDITFWDKASLVTGAAGYMCYYTNEELHTRHANQRERIEIVLDTVQRPHNDTV